MTDIISIVECLQRASQEYYDGTPTLTDPEFDKLKHKLRELDPSHPFLFEVGASVSGTIRQHSIPMGSLDNVNDEDEFRKWWDKLPANCRELVVQYKYDGLSLGLEYEQGRLKYGLTRGNGVTGEDRTTNIRNCRNSHGNADGVVDQLDDSFNGSVRGEGVIFIEDFTDLNFPGESNPRNSAVGAIRKDESPRAKWVRVICYDVINGSDFATEIDKLTYMKELGLPVAEHWVCTTPEQVLEIYARVQEERNTIPFLVDGIVLKVSDIKAQTDMGLHNGRPRGQTAFKFKCMEAITTLRKVELAVGHTGNITLRGHYDPVVLGGRTFRHANLDNFDLITERGISVGSSVRLQIAGDIIPRLVECLDPAYVCPECGFVGTLKEQQVHHS